MTNLSVMYTFSVIKSKGVGFVESFGSHGARGSIYNIVTHIITNTHYIINTSLYLWIF